MPSPVSANLGGFGARYGTFALGSSASQRVLSVSVAVKTGTLGVFYTSVFFGSGGTGPYTFSIISGSLPPGLTLIGSTGALTGTPTNIGTYSFTIQVTDTGTGSTASRPETITINPTYQFIGYNYGLAGPYGSPPNSFSLNVKEGDTIIVETGLFWSINADVYQSTVADDQSNVYLGGWYEEENFGRIMVWYAVARATGTIHIVVSPGPPGLLGNQQSVTVCNFRNVPPFDQVSFNLNAGPSSGTAFWTSGVVTYANSVVVTAMFIDSFNGFGDGHVVMTNGENQRLPQPFQGGPNTAIWDRAVVGPGNGYSQCTQVGNTANIAFVTLVFSGPLLRPTGLTAQYALRPGEGEEAEPGPPKNPANIPINRPLTISLPYTPQIGSILVVAVAPSFGDIPVGGVSDAYGQFIGPSKINNLYTRVAHATTPANVSIFTCRVRFLPPAGQVFQISIAPTIPVGGGLYQCTAVSLTEYVIGAVAPTYQPFYFLSTTATGGLNFRMATNPTSGTPAGTMLIGFAFYMSPGNANNQTVTWGAREGYTIQAQWGIMCFQGSITNQLTNGVAAYFDKIAPALGDYDAQIDGLQGGSVLDTGSATIALLAMSTTPAVAISVACPINNLIYMGSPYSGQVQVTGGLPPFTFIVVGGQLPPGLTLDPVTGIISGTPTRMGFFQYTVEVIDNALTVGTVTCGYNVQPPQELGAPIGAFELIRVTATMRPARHKPVRGSSN